jgi:rhodanese-related sulfurtransferase
MKKLLAIFAAFALVMTLTACGGEAKLPADGEITMANIDEYLGRDGAQYIDLRNLEDRLKDGYVSGFSVIPYFNYLNNEKIITGTGDATTVVDQARVEQLFDKEAPAIFLMCASGGRAGWVKGALEGLGYTNVYNVGGFKDYPADGAFKVSGDGSYNLDVPAYGDLTPGLYVAQVGKTVAYVTVSENGGVQSIVFDAMNCNESDDDETLYTSCDSKQGLGDNYNMVTYGGATQEWYKQANELAAGILAAGGWDADWTTEVNAKGHDVFVDGLSGVTIGVEDFKTAYEAAVALATPAS